MTSASQTAARTDADDAVGFLRQLVQAQPRGENAVQALISERLTRAGCKVAAFDYDPNTVPVLGELVVDGQRNAGPRRAIVGTLDGDASLPSLLMFAHPDGEPVSGTEAWSHDPFAGQIDGDRLYGWGVADDLAGCAAAVLAIEKAAASRDISDVATPLFRAKRADLVEPELIARAEKLKAEIDAEKKAE